MIHTITLKELRPELPEVMNKIESKLDRYVITRHGKPLAVLMSVDEYESMAATIELLSDEAAMKRIKKAEKEIKAGKIIPMEESRRRIEGV